MPSLLCTPTLIHLAGVTVRPACKTKQATPGASAHLLSSPVSSTAGTSHLLTFYKIISSWQRPIVHVFSVLEELLQCKYLHFER